MKTKPQIINEKLKSMEIGETVNRNDLIDLAYWKDAHEDYFTRRAFDVHYTKAKKGIKAVFKSVKGVITKHHESNSL